MNEGPADRGWSPMPTGGAPPPPPQHPAYPAAQGAVERPSFRKPLRPFFFPVILLGTLWLVVEVAVFLLNLRLQQDLGAGPTAQPPAGLALVMGLTLLGSVLGIALLLVGGFLFYRAAVNVDLMGAQDRTWGNYWAFLAWVIPVASAVLSYLFVRELWKASTPHPTTHWSDEPVPVELNLWGLAWGGSLLIGFGVWVMTQAIILRAGFTGDLQPDLTPAQIVTGIGYALKVVALPFFIWLLVALDRRQSEREAALAHASHQAASYHAPPTGTF